MHRSGHGRARRGPLRRFPYEGWLPPHVDEGFNRIMGPVSDRADGLLLGRRSYDILSAHWPAVPGEEGGAKINSMPEYVTTRAPMTAGWRNTEVLAGEAAETVAALKRRTDGTILGQGERLFAEGSVPAGLKLTGSDTTASGVVHLTYEWAGKPSYGSVA